MRIKRLSPAWICLAALNATACPQKTVSTAPEPSSSKPSIAASTTPSRKAPTPSSAVSPPAPTLQLPKLKGGPRSASGTKGIVTSVEPNATRAGIEVLEAGGNAIDAAVAVGYALAVTHPSAGNIGGGGFMLIRKHGHETVAIDFREKAPHALTQQRFDAMIKNRARGPAAVGVPGSVAGLNLAHERFGKLPRERVLAPAITLAKEGHRIEARQAKALGWAWPYLKRDPSARAIFGRGARALRKGELLKQPDLANTLQLIAERGDAGFYAGETAKAIATVMQVKGMIDAQDLKEYRARPREPLTFEYRGFEVQVMPPASAGGVAVTEMLLALAQIDKPPAAPGSAQAVHRFVEVAKRAHAERRFGVMDPDISGYEDAERRRRWLDPKTLLGGAHPILPDKATPSKELHPLYKAALRELEHTTHFSVVDAEGNAVSCTTTLSAGFGAKFVVPGTGVVMNNSLAAFGTVGDDVPRPSQRMTSSMSPTLVLDHGKTVAILGSPGGDTIPNTVVQVLRNLVDHSMLVEDAVDAPRVHHGFVPDAIRYEKARPLAPNVLAELRAMGHRISKKTINIGDANVIVIDEQMAWGYADPREGGLAAAAKATETTSP